MSIKEISTGVCIVLFAGAIGWTMQTLIEVDKRTAIMAEKVSENHKMITPLWEDFIRRSKPNDNLAKLDDETDSKAWFKWK
jgi:hypothetical protein